MADAVRLDVWLDVACLAKTRSQAKELCDRGKVQIGGVGAKAKARELFQDVTPPPSPEELELRRLERLGPPPAPPRGSGRPEKRARRRMERMRGW
jgi:ribosome-associated heat shock protein Hsp15